MPPPPGGYGDDGRFPIVATLLVTGVVLLTVLIAGPAFTASGPRHRRALGQLASNSATTAVLRRYVLAQALLLGVFATLVAVVAGAGLGAAAFEIARRVAPRHADGPIDVPVGRLAGLWLVGSASALIAAVVPAVVASRVDVVHVLHGHVSPRVVRRGLPVIGAALAVVGAVLLWVAVTARHLSGGETWVALGGFLLFGGTVLGLPWLLTQVARAAAVLPLTGRLAARDIGRQRARATSGVAAIMGATALMTALAIGGASDTAQQRRDYRAQAPMGQGVLVSPSPAAEATLRRDHSLEVYGVRTVAPYEMDAHRTQHLVLAVPAGCPTAHVDNVTDEDRCPPPVGDAPTGWGRRIAAIEPAKAAKLLDLTTSQETWLRQGHALSLPPDPTSQPRRTVDAGRLTLSAVTVDASDQQTASVPAGSLPVHPVTSSRARRRAYPIADAVLVVAPSVVAAHHWPSHAVDGGVFVVRRDGSGLTHEQEQAITDRLPDGVGFVVERGYTSRDTLIVEVMIAVFALVMLAVTLLATALLQSETAAEQATLAAIGAPRRIRRRLSGTYAVVIALVGGLVGGAVGAVPGVAVVWPLTTRNTDGATSPIVVVPWALPVAILAVPLVAGLLAAAVTGSNPPVTRRRTT